MEEEANTTKNAIRLNKDWEVYFVDKSFGWMIRCIHHSDVRRDGQEPVLKRTECSCLPPMIIWKKLLFLDKLYKL